ncbi:hypothetical protein QCN27_03000 [Cereibacter sp. SYSU M97828]|nr:hypothetical protein [Cereibacter flavus]
MKAACIALALLAPPTGALADDDDVVLMLRDFLPRYEMRGWDDDDRRVVIRDWRWEDDRRRWRDRDDDDDGDDDDDD